MYGTSFTAPVGNRVLTVVFAGDPKDMYEYACQYDPGKGGPKDLGIEFRELIGTRNRTSWWKGAKLWLEENFESQLDQSASAIDLSKEASLDATSHSFTKPTAEKVLEEIFAGNVQSMYEYACAFNPGRGGPYDLGSKFREIIKTRNRTSWWSGTKLWIEKSFKENS